MVKSLSIAFTNLIKLRIAVHATKRPNVFRRPYGTWVEGDGSTTIPYEGFWNTDIFSYKIKVEILNTKINRSTAQSQMESVKIR